MILKSLMQLRSLLLLTWQPSPLTALQVGHLTSPKRLVFGSGLLPSVAEKRASCALVTCLAAVQVNL